nr:unnamed protein product [Digitaria exilis]
MLILLHRDVCIRDQFGDLESLGYPALPEPVPYDQFGDEYGKGVWSELSETASSNIYENIVALASFNGHKFAGPLTFDCQYLGYTDCRITKAGIGGPLLKFDGTFAGMNFYDEIEGTPYLSARRILTVLENFKTKRYV